MPGEAEIADGAVALDERGGKGDEPRILGLRLGRGSDGGLGGRGEAGGPAGEEQGGEEREGGATHGGDQAQRLSWLMFWSISSEVWMDLLFTS